MCAVCRTTQGTLTDAQHSRLELLREDFRRSALRFSRTDGRWGRRCPLVLQRRRRTPRAVMGVGVKGSPARAGACAHERPMPGAGFLPLPASGRAARPALHDRPVEAVL